MPCHLASISAADSNTRGTYFDSTSCHTGIMFIKHKDLLPKIRQHRLKSFVSFKVLIVVMLTIQSKSSVIWRCVNTWVFYGILKVHSAFTFRFKQFKRNSSWIVLIPKVKASQSFCMSGMTHVTT